jgi:hypothetical protein
VNVYRVRAVKDVLALHATFDGLVDVVGQLEDADALGETCASVLGVLKQSRDDGCLEDAKQPSFLIQLGQLILTWPDASTKHALPLGMLHFEGMEGREESGSLTLTVSCLRPSFDVVITWRLPAIFQLRNLGSLP